MTDYGIIILDNQEYRVVRNHKSPNLILKPVTISKGDKRTPLSAYTNDELLDEIERRAQPRRQVQIIGEEQDFITGGK